MSDYNSNATSTIYVNGQPAHQEIDKLKKDVLDYRKRLQEIAADKSLGVNSKEWDNVRKQMLAAEKELGRVQSGVANVTQVMLRLDKATPKELRKSLKELKKDLENIERGSNAWDEQQKKIRAVKEELAKINAESKAVQGNLWDRFAKKMFDWGAAIQMVVASFNGLRSSAQQAVRAFAEMDQEMANVRKYTGMTSDEVERLNEEFKKMNTRSSREQLNQLAQEAGRLGMQSQEDVMGFVRAADKINVALDELGEGATLTLSKLTNIFGDRERLGVEKSLLAVGSVINELSQNCTASAPYIAEFASRLAGVGANAGMTTQQIMGYAAVMDSYGQKVESSATALSQVIVRLYRDPAKYAKVAGLDVKNFTDLLKNDANAALIQLLETLNKIGGMDVLSPMFADMGENGARAIQALSTMAKHIDEVKSQQEVANQAFEEAISIDKEFNVQNNTVQAGLEKAKKGFNEMAIALGEKLAPLMKYTISSSSALLRVLSMVVDFFIKFKGALVTLAAAWAGYTIAVNFSNIAFRVHYTWLVLVEKAQQIGRVATLAWAVAYNKLTGNITRADAAQKMLNNTIKLNPWGFAIAAVTALGMAIYNAAKKTDEFTKSIKENISAANGVTAEYVKEQHELDVLFGKLKGAEKGSDDYKAAKKAIIDQYGKYLSGLLDEKGEIINLTDAYDRLTEAIRRSARERGIANARQAIEDKYTQQTAEDLNRLQESLEKYGVSAQQAAETVQQVATALMTGKDIPKEARDVLERASRNMPWYESWASGRKDQVQYSGPAGIVNNMYRHQGEYQKGMKGIEAMERGVNPYGKFTARDLDGAIERLEKLVGTHDYGSALVLIEGTNQVEFQNLTPVQAQALLHKYKEERAYRAGGGGKTTPSSPPGGGYTHHETEKERKARLAEEKKRKAEEAKQARIAAALEKKEFKDAMDLAKAHWDTQQTEALKQYRSGQLDYEAYLENLHESAQEYYEKALKIHKQHGTEESDAAAKLYKAQEKEKQDHEKKMLQLRLDRYADERDATKIAIQMGYYDASNEAFHNQRVLDERLAQNEIEYLRKVLSERAAGTQEYYDAERALDKAIKQEELRQRKQLEQDLATWSLAYQKLSLQKQMEAELAVVDEVAKHEKWTTEETEKIKAGIRKKYRDKRRSEIDSATGTTAPGSAMDGLATDRDNALDALEKERAGMTDEEYQSRRHQIIKKYHDSVTELIRSEGSEWATMITNVYEKWSSALESLGGTWEEKLKSITDLAEASFAVMNVGLQMYMENAAAARDLEVAKAEKSYERQISMAEGNAYKTKQLEKKKNKEVARIKNEYNKKAQTIEIAQAIASTAMAAINAYASASKVSWILGPIAAAMATAAGMMQIATIKKQHEAEAAGYSKGGFTPDGRPDEPVGVVHAGEWVASQKLLKNPQARAAIEALDYAQRNNTIGRLNAADVSRSVTAPQVIAGAAGDGSMQRTMTAMVVVMERYGDTMERLGQRLDEPFVTVNTVTGDTGIKQAQDEYQRLQNNTLPKSKRK